MKGIRIAAFMLCVVFATSALAGMGWFATAGVSLDPGLDEEAEQVETEYEDQEANPTGSDNDFSLVGSAASTLNALRILTTQAGPALKRMGVPPEIATGIAGMVTFAMAMVVVQVIRGIRFG